MPLGVDPAPKEKVLVAGADCAEKNDPVVGVAAVVVEGVPNENVDVLLGWPVVEGENSDEEVPVLVPVPNVNAMVVLIKDWY
jgi:hypothetical protein